MTTLPTRVEAITEAADLLGPAPLLNSENASDFDSLFKKVAAALLPRDAVELIYTRRFVCEAWVVERYARHAAVAVERLHHESLQHQQMRAKFHQARKRQRNGNTLASATPTDIAALAALEENMMMSVDTDVDEILTRKVSELDHNRALARGIELQRQLDSLIASATHRRDDALLQLELYRTGLGAGAKEVTDRVLEGEFQEVSAPVHEAPALMPSNEEATDDAETAADDAEAK